MIRKTFLALSLAALTLTATPPKSDAAFLVINYLYNNGFETPDPVIPSGFIDHGSTTAPWFAGWGTAAESWPATSNDLNYGAISTWLRSDVVHGGSTSILVAASTNNGGIAQQYLTSTRLPAHQKFTVWVYVVAGTVYAGMGSGSTGFATAQSMLHGQWEKLTTCGTSANNTVYVYTMNGPAVYYVDDASVSIDSVNCP